jgi:hypothetical protein
LLAAETLLNRDRAPGQPQQVSGGLFWHLSNQQVSGLVRPGDEALDLAREHLARHVNLARAGDFAVHPNPAGGGWCVRYCEFHQLCRVSGTNRHKRGQ